MVSGLGSQLVDCVRICCNLPNEQALGEEVRDISHRLNILLNNLNLNRGRYIEHCLPDLKFYMAAPPPPIYMHKWVHPASGANIGMAFEAGVHISHRNI